jgi:DNA modification methylase
VYTVLPIRTAFNRKHDTILVYTKGDTYTFNVDAVRLPYNPVTVKTFASSPRAGFGKIPNLKRGKVPEDWWYFPVVARLHSERSGYPTQKPEALLQRIVLASSNPGDLVADFFCGSGTTATVAARHGRRFILSDINFRAVHTSQARLVAGGSPAFMVRRVKGFDPIKADDEFADLLSLKIEDRTAILDAGARGDRLKSIQPGMDGFSRALRRQ